TFGDISCFSFYGNKVITTGEGGMSLTDDLKLNQKMRMLEDIHYATKKTKAKDRFHTEFIGYNYRMTNIEAAIGVAQTKRIDGLVSKKREIAHYYNELLKDIEDVITPPEMPWAKNVYWYYSILVDKEKRDKLMDGLGRKGIETRPFFYPLHKLKMHKTNGKSQILPVAEDLYQRGINLPSSPRLSKKQIEYVCSSIRQILVR
ncbi:MAG: DegT/DnrJ/EryC1/StrS aminotransferase family protein, partial [Candidatus Micrarchaeota archaeon]|nr:DegT/DnrJ/EryC1/StrS aminotransferase family protein [Candidatus Micrarchaeota archaeon]